MKSILSIWKSAGNCFSDSNIPGSVFWNNFCITLLSDIAPLNAVLSLLLMHFFHLSLNLKKIFLDATLHAKPGCFTNYLLWLPPPFERVLVNVFWTSVMTNCLFQDCIVHWSRLKNHSKVQTVHSKVHCFSATSFSLMINVMQYHL